MGERDEEFFEDQHADEQEAPEVSLATEDTSGVDAVIAALEAERDELRDRMLRAMAEAENMRKRADRDRREAEHYGGSKLSRDLLPVYDNMSRALESADEASREVASGLIEGVELTLKSLTTSLEKFEVKTIESVGEVFDPNVHEAMTMAASETVAVNHVVSEFERGYFYKDRLLRAAKVIVSSGKAES